MNDGAPDWQEWFDAHAPRLLLFARQWLPDRADAEDAVQAGFVKFWRNRPQPAAADVPLLFAAVRSAALDFIKSRSRREKREARVADVERERVAAIQAALASLPIEQREAVTLRIWGGLTFAEIAATLDENINTVASRFRAALTVLGRRIPEVCRDSTD